MRFEEELKKLPDRPGVYLMHDAGGEVLYVGKARSLKNRVKQYFQKTVNRGPQILKMIEEISWFETITVDSETEALILECNLIKQYRPRYNTALTDDKAYPYICLTAEDYPRVRLARQIRRDKNEYYGPYVSNKAVHETVRLIQLLFGIRSCERKLPETCGKERPCLNFEMGRCPAPCRGTVPTEEYGRNVERARRFLKGDYAPVLRFLKQKMQAASERLDFEEAMRLRDQIYSVQSLSERQKVSDGNGEDRDVLAFAVNGSEGIAQIFFVRDGRMIGRDHIHIRVAEGDARSTVLSDLIKQFYSGTPVMPKEILVETEPDDGEALRAMLAARTGRKVELRVPRKGEKSALLSLARENAERILKQEMDRVSREEARTAGAQAELVRLLGLPGAKRLEAYDISHISGFATVGSMIVYEDGRPKKNEYRKFRIRFTEGVSDVGSLAEVLYRRFRHGLRERQVLRETAPGQEEGFVHFPDLILMDGGTGQVHAAEAVLEELQLDIPVCGMVKDDRHRTRGLICRGREVPLDPHSEVFHLLTRIQDETHRFAIEYHRSLRGKAQVHSILDDIPGIGTARRRALLKAMPNIDTIRGASTDELAAVPGMNRSAAQNVYAFFHEGEAETH